jgi:hypothetical protein
MVEGNVRNEKWLNVDVVLFNLCGSPSIIEGFV